MLEGGRRGRPVSRGDSNRLLIFALGSIMVQALVEQTAFLIMEGQTATAICLDVRHIA